MIAKIPILRDLSTTYIDLNSLISQGESFSVVDHKEAWIMDVISKGPNELGAVWIAARVPDGMVAVHANHSRIRTFPRDDPENIVYAPDVISFARENGLYHGSDEDFSYSDVYDAKPSGKLRYAEARVWDMYTAFLQDNNFAQQHLAYAMGRDKKHPMPLFIKPKNKITLNDVRARMASHFEGTPFAYGDEVAGGLFSHPYRARPYLWFDDHNNLYVNERNIGVEKTGINFIAQIRPHMPPPLRALLWFGADDASTAPRFPAYAASTDVSKAYKGKSTAQGHIRPILDFDLSKAFWVDNMVSNFAYSRWRDAYPVVKAKLDEIQADFVAAVHNMDNRAHELYSADPEAAIEEVTRFSMSRADELHRKWQDFYGVLFARFRDFVITEVDPSNLACGCKTTEVGMTDEWKRRVIGDTGSHYRVENDHPNWIGLSEEEIAASPIYPYPASGYHEGLKASVATRKVGFSTSLAVLVILPAAIFAACKTLDKIRLRKNQDSYASLQSALSMEGGADETTRLQDTA